MNNDIKEILKDDDELLVYYKDNSFESFDTLPQNVLDYITNLQRANKNHSKKIIEMGNKITNLQEENHILRRDYATVIHDNCYVLELENNITNLQKIEKEHQKLNGELREEINFLKLNNPDANIEHFRVVGENKRKINNLRAENKRLKKTIVIMEKYLELIHDLGYDYDGLNYEHDLKGLIDEMVRFASLGRAYNTTKEIYVDGKGKSFNILGEELKEDNNDKN